VLLRSPSAAATLTATYGDRVQPVLYKGMDDTDKTTAVASEHYIVINCTVGYHTPSGLALIRGLAQRKAITGQPVWYLHTSGTPNLGDRLVSGKYLHSPADREFDDVVNDVYDYEKSREAAKPYPQRTAELGVSTVIIMSPLIYGVGTGLFGGTSVQVPAMVAHGAGYGSGRGYWRWRGRVGLRARRGHGRAVSRRG